MKWQAEVLFYPLQTNHYAKYHPFLVQILKSLCDKLAIISTIEMAVVENTPQKQQTMNQQYRHLDYVPDVLSFPIVDNIREEKAWNKKAHLWIGDVFLCPKTIQEQAKQQERTYEYEYLMLYLHSCLHLIGFNHINDREQKEMFTLTDDILNALQITTSLKI